MVIAVVVDGVVANLVEADANWRPDRGTAVRVGGRTVDIGDGWDGESFVPSANRGADKQQDAMLLSRRAALRLALLDWDTLVATQQTSVMQAVFPALLREVLGE